MDQNTCKNCKALGVTAQGFICNLEYKIDQERAIPLECCSKPLLYLDYIEERKEKCSP